jgi:hypothetical protein
MTISPTMRKVIVLADDQFLRPYRYSHWDGRVINSVCWRTHNTSGRSQAAIIVIWINPAYKPRESLPRRVRAATPNPMYLGLSVRSQILLSIGDVDRESARPVNHICGRMRCALSSREDSWLENCHWHCLSQLHREKSNPVQLQCGQVIESKPFPQFQGRYSVSTRKLCLRLAHSISE